MTNINGYEIAKLECGSGWGVMKSNESSGKLFSTKKSAISWAKAQ